MIFTFYKHPRRKICCVDSKTEGSQKKNFFSTYEAISIFFNRMHTIFFVLPNGIFVDKFVPISTYNKNALWRFSLFSLYYDGSVKDLTWIVSREYDRRRMVTITLDVMVGFVFLGLILSDYGVKEKLQGALGNSAWKFPPKLCFTFAQTPLTLTPKWKIGRVKSLFKYSQLRKFSYVFRGTLFCMFDQEENFTTWYFWVFS